MAAAAALDSLLEVEAAPQKRAVPPRARRFFPNLAANRHLLDNATHPGATELRAWITSAPKLAPPFKGRQLCAGQTRCVDCYFERRRVRTHFNLTAWVRPGDQIICGHDLGPQPVAEVPLSGDSLVLEVAYPNPDQIEVPAWLVAVAGFHEHAHSMFALNEMFWCCLSKHCCKVCLQRKYETKGHE